MNAHIDITLIDNPEVACAVLMGAVFDCVHSDIVSLQLIGKIAIDFPEATEDGVKGAAQTGNVLRLYGNDDDLASMASASKRWRGLQGRFRSTAVVVLGAGHQRQRWVRTQPRSFTPAGIDRLVRRRLARASKNTVTAAQLHAELQGKGDEWQRKFVSTHHIHVKSASSSQRFALFMKRDRKVMLSDHDVLNSHGLGC